MSAAPLIVDSWSPDRWRDYDALQQPTYADLAELARIEHELGRAGPVVAIEDCAK